MRVALPFCSKDEHLALMNLDWALSLDGKVPFDAVLCVDNKTDASKVLEKAKAYFNNVEVFTYNAWLGKEQDWPVPQNWAWQQTAKHMAKQKDFWLWWEADAVPLHSDWLKALESEYQRLSKPFMGVWVTNNGHCYMAGVAVYPASVAPFCTTALIVQRTSFDIELGQFITHQHSETSLICHRIEPMTFVTRESVRSIPDSAVLFHKCKDGTLIEKLKENQSGKANEFIGEAKKAIAGAVGSVRNFIVEKAPNPGVVVYVPPPHVGFPQVFLDNLYDFLPTTPLFVLSDYPWRDAIMIPDPVKQVGKDKTRMARFIFQEVLKFAVRRKLTHIIYLESDCRIKGINWDQRLLDEFFAFQKAIVGGALAVAGPSASGLQFATLFQEKIEKFNGLNSDGSRQTWPIMEQGQIPECEAVAFVNGAPAIYSVEALTSLCDIEHNAMLDAKYPYDFEVGRLICQKFGPIEAITNRIVHLPGVLATEGERLIPFSVRTSLLTDQKVYAVHPIKTRWRPVKDVPRFYHSGDYGDLIYALLTIKLFGGGQLWLGPETRTKYPPRAAFTKEAFETIKPLLEQQSYLSLIDFAPKYPEVHFDLNIFRDYWSSVFLRNSTGIHTLAQMHAYSMGLQDVFNPEPWLNVPESVTMADVVIHRSPRYQDSSFPWKQIMDRFKGRCAFVGVFDEHKEFCRKYGNLPFYPTSNLLELAKIIKGAKWFIGNQSLPCALAIGMGQNVYQETFETSPDCVFKLPNFFNQSTPLDQVPWML